jgi:hypothetical protein
MIINHLMANGQAFPAKKGELSGNVKRSDLVRKKSSHSI